MKNKNSHSNQETPKILHEQNQENLIEEKKEENSKKVSLPQTATSGMKKVVIRNQKKEKLPKVIKPLIKRK